MNKQQWDRIHSNRFKAIALQLNIVNSTGELLENRVIKNILMSATATIQTLCDTIIEDTHGAYDAKG